VLYNKTDMAGNASTLGWWFAVNLRKLVGFVVVIFVLFWVISQPSNAGDRVNGVMGNLKDAGQSIVTFIGKVL
jgi:hypothetical protein